MSFFDPADVATLRADQRQASGLSATVRHWATRSADAGGAPDATSATTTYTGVLVRMGAPRQNSGPQLEQAEVFAQPPGSIPLFVAIDQPTSANVAAVTAIATDDEVTIGGRRYVVVSALPLAPERAHRTVYVKEAR